MTLPLGPEGPRLPFAPQPPLPFKTAPQMPQPIHPLHTESPGELLVPPEDIPGKPDARPHATTLRPASLAARQASQPPGEKPTPETPGESEHTPTPSPTPLTEATHPTPPAEIAERRKSIPRSVGSAALHAMGVEHPPLPARPNRLETVEEVNRHEGALTRIVLVEHLPENAAVIANTVRGSDVVAIEAIHEHESEQSQRNLETVLTQLTSSDPVVSAEAKEALARMPSLRQPFLSAVVKELEGSDTIIKLTDINNLGNYAEYLDRIDDTQQQVNAYIHHPERPSAELSALLAARMSAIITCHKLRDKNFAEHLDELRATYPDKQIDQIVGRAHREISEHLDISHVHTFVAGSPTYKDTYTDKMAQHSLNNPNTPHPQTLLDRYTLLILYDTASRSANSKLVRAENYSTSHPDYDTAPPELRLTELLFENMADDDVRNALVIYDKINDSIGKISKSAAAWARQQLFAKLEQKYGYRPSAST